MIIATVVVNGAPTRRFLIQADSLQDAERLLNERNLLLITSGDSPLFSTKDKVTFEPLEFVDNVAEV